MAAEPLWPTRPFQDRRSPCPLTGGRLKSIQLADQPVQVVGEEGTVGAVSTDQRSCAPGHKQVEGGMVVSSEWDPAATSSAGT